MSKALSFIGSLAIVGMLLLGCMAVAAQAQEATTITTASGGQSSGELTCWGSATGGGCGKWEHSNTAPLAALSIARKILVPGKSRTDLKEVVLGEGWECWKVESDWKCGDPSEVPTVRLGQMHSWGATEPICNCLSSANCCSQDTAISTPGNGSIVITPGDTTISSPGLKIYTTPLGIPCGDAFPMPGCLPAEMQGWAVQIEGGTKQRFDVSFTWRDADGVEHTERQTVARAPQFQGKPSFTFAVFRVGRAKSVPWFPIGTEKIRTVVSEYDPGPDVAVEHAREN